MIAEKQAVRQRLTQLGPNELDLLPGEVEITESSATEILRNIASTKWTALEVVNAFIHRAKIAHFHTNCLTEVFFEDAVATSRELDQFQRETGRLKGQLHGLPVSFKDEFNIKNQYSTIGLESNLSRAPESEDSPVVSILRDAGAVFYVKTNVPVGVFNTTTFNPIFGETKSCTNETLNAGGSSGGEAALVGSCGSPLGVGSDLGGSIRQPSGFNAIFGLKPSSGRFPHNSTSVLKGLESLSATNGPMARDVETLGLYCKVIADAKPWEFDSKCVPLPWKDDIKFELKKVAILHDDGVIVPTAPVQRGIELLKEKLVEHNIEVVEWDINKCSISEIAEFADEFMTSNGQKTLLSKLGLPFDPSKDLQVSKLWELQNDRYLKCNNYLRYFSELGIDCLVAPISPVAGCGKDEFIDSSYSPFPNVLNVSAGTIPVTKVDLKLDSQPVTSSFRNELERKVHQNYAVEDITGSGVGLQVVCRQFEEEKLVEIMKCLSAIVN